MVKPSQLKRKWGAYNKEPDIHELCDRGTTPWQKGEPSTQQDVTATLSCVCCQAPPNPNEWVTLGQE
eukprot:3739056-Ditylum_brightwellii.AAC.1